MRVQLSIIVSLTVLLLFSLEASHPRHAENFRLVEEGHSVLLVVRNPWQGAGETEFRYRLIRSRPGDAAVPVVAGEQRIHIPVRRVVALSTTHLPAIEAAGGLDSIVGIASRRYVNHPLLRERVTNGSLKEVGSEMHQNLEVVLALQPDVVFTHAMGMPDQDIHPSLASVGITAAVAADYMETTALGRAEWLLFIAAFYDKVQEAVELFDSIEARYEKLLEKVRGVPSRPTVFANAPWGNVWHIPSGQSYVANLIRDAGGQYVWEDLPGSGAQPLDFEQVYMRAVNADFWINTSYLDSIARVKDQDRRYGDFRSVRKNQVFNPNRLTNPEGGNAIYERGTLHPDEVLGDLIRIFHPERLQEHEFVYYKRLE